MTNEKIINYPYSYIFATKQKIPAKCRNFFAKLI